MARTLANFIETNYNEFKGFVKAGIISPTTLNNYNMYCQFCELNKDIKSKMLRFSIVADKNKVSEKTVIRAVREMQKTL